MGVEEVGAVGRAILSAVARQRPGSVVVDLRSPAGDDGSQRSALGGADVDAEVDATAAAWRPARCRRSSTGPATGRASSDDDGCRRRPGRGRRRSPRASPWPASTLPVTRSPWARWNASTAPGVPDPKTPSAPPRTAIPAVDQGVCRATTAGTALVVDGEAGRRPARSRGSGSGGRRRRRRSCGETEHAGRRLVDRAGDGDAVVPLRLPHGAGGVAGPKMPSAPPRSVHPKPINVFCNCTTAGPREPKRRPTTAVALPAAGASAGAAGAGWRLTPSTAGSPGRCGH